MTAKRHLSVLLTFILGWVSTSAMAHSGEHGQSMMAWLQHLLGSNFHLLSLLGLTVILTVAPTAWRWLRMPLKRDENISGAD